MRLADRLIEILGEKVPVGVGCIGWGLVVAQMKICGPKGDSRSS